MTYPRALVDRITKRFYTSYETEIGIKKLNSNVSKNIYGETKNKKYLDPVLFKGYLEVEPTELRLQELGWLKDTPEILIQVPYVSMEEVELVTVKNGVLTYHFSTEDLLYIPSLEKPFRISKIQGKEPFIEGKPTYIYIGGRKLTDGG